MKSLLFKKKDKYGKTLYTSDLVVSFKQMTNLKQCRPVKTKAAVATENITYISKTKSYNTEYYAYSIYPTDNIILWYSIERNYADL